MTTLSTTPTPQSHSSPVPFINADGSANIDECECSNPKMAIYFSCKACTVRQGRYNIEVEHDQDVCPICGDGRNPTFSFCTNCATERRYINVDRRVNLNCPQDSCECGTYKPMAYSLCHSCRHRQTSFVTIHEPSDRILNSA